MIRYALRCSAGHGFESWFRSAEAYEGLRAAGHVACPVCGTTEVEKALMTPQVRPSRRPAAAAEEPAPAPASAPAPAPAQEQEQGPLSLPASEREKRLAALRRQVESNSDYVGMEFAAEARRIHSGEAPERLIHGEARAEEARALLEEGVPVAPLPFLPLRKAN